MICYSNVPSTSARIKFNKINKLTYLQIVLLIVLEDLYKCMCATNDTVYTCTVHNSNRDKFSLIIAWI